ncbi:hypothetical protein [Hymenobacter nivis]|nr:hypothetical protein [Hymenobacter nivis]
MPALRAQGLPALVTAATKRDEWARWPAKLGRNRVATGTVTARKPTK